jgi:hypothetical protein
MGLVDPALTLNLSFARVPYQSRAAVSWLALISAKLARPPRSSAWSAAAARPGCQSCFPLGEVRRQGSLRGSGRPKLFAEKRQKGEDGPVRTGIRGMSG